MKFNKRSVSLLKSMVWVRFIKEQGSWIIGLFLSWFSDYISKMRHFCMSECIVYPGSSDQNFRVSPSMGNNMVPNFLESENFVVAI